MSSSEDLSAEYKRLTAITDALRREHEDIEQRPVDLAEHAAHVAKLRAHIAELRAHIEELRRRND